MNTMNTIDTLSSNFKSGARIDARELATALRQKDEAEAKARREIKKEAARKRAEFKAQKAEAIRRSNLRKELPKDLDFNVREFIIDGLMGSDANYSLVFDRQYGYCYGGLSDADGGKIEAEDDSGYRCWVAEDEVVIASPKPLAEMLAGGQ